MTPRDLALAWAAAGYPVFPYNLPEKKPHIKWKEIDRAAPAGQLAKWWDKWPDAWPFVITGPLSGLTVVDVDRHPGKPDGKKAIDENVPAVWGSTPALYPTRGGGIHLYYASEGERNASRQKTLGLDVRGDGGLALIYGPPPDRNALPPMPDELRTLLRPRIAGAHETPDDCVGDHEPISIYDLQPPMGAKLLAEAMQEGVDRSAHAMTVAAGMLGEGYTPEQVLGVMLEPSNPCAAHCHDHRDPEYAARRVASNARANLRLAAPEKVFASSGGDDLPPGATEEAGWDHGLERGSGNRVASSWSNIYTILRASPVWAGLLRFNTVTQRAELTAPVPGVDGDVPGAYPRAAQDHDYTAAIIYLERAWAMSKPAKSAVADVIDRVSRERPYDPIAEYLLSLEWDGVPRISFWLHRYCGADGADPLVSAMGRKWLLSAVKRALEPGCKVDCMLVLEGAQGIGKSSALAILARQEDWFTDSLPDITHKDSSEALTGRWIVELSDLVPHKRAEIATFKAFISRQVEKYRPSYGRNVVEVPRRCVFAGSTNDAQYLTDPTGNRRFWPVRCGDRQFDLGGLKRDRDQVWAEAVAAVLGGESCVLPPELWSLAAQAQAERVEPDPWDEMVPDVLVRLAAASQPFKSSAILQHLGERVGAPQSRRLAAAMERLGYSRPKGGTVWVRGGDGV